MKRKRRSVVGTAVLAVVACNVYDPTLLTGGDTVGAGAVGGGGGKGGRAASAGGAGVGGTQTAGGAGVGGSGVAGSSLAQGGAGGGGSSGMDNQGGASAEGGEGGTNEAGNDPGGTGGGAGRGGGAGAGAGGVGVGGTSGRGGTSGTGGGSGTAGSGGSSGRGGSAGAGGSAGTGGTGGSPPIIEDGCAKLTVTIDDAADVAHFPITFTTTTGLDFSAAVITMRVYAPAASGGSIFNYVQDLPDFHYLGNSTRPAFTAGWQTLTWNVGAQALGTSTTDKTKIKRIGIEVNAGTATSWATPTVLYVDSITVATPAQTFTFDTSDTLNTTAAEVDPTSSPILWINSYAEDTTATGVTLSWVATCP